MTLLFGGHHEELVPGLPPLARPRRRDRGGRVRARRRPLPARGLRERARTTSSCCGSRPTGRARSRSDRTTTAATTPSSGSRGRTTWSGGAVGARGTAFSYPRTRRRGGRDGRARSATTSPFGEPTRSRSSSPRRPTSATTTTSGRAARRSTPRPVAGYAELRARHVESHRPPMRRVRLRLGDQPDAGSRGAPDRRAPRARQGRGARPWPRRAALPVRALPAARLEPSRHPAGEPAGDLERQLPARLGQQVHDQHQPADELLAGRGREPGGVSRAALRPDRPASRHRRARRHALHYGCGGFVAHHNTDLWADTAPLDNVFCGLWPAGAAWLAHHLWEQLRLRPRRGVPPRARLPGDEGGGPLRARLPGRGPRERASSCSAPRSRPRTSTSTRTASARASA